ncbi:MAG TPA: hypothetical protein VFL84_08395, partial [Gammaproteobacteria bacterium]|nr:hypothetical protein [Gammaproteobacteria bacterium]
PPAEAVVSAAAREGGPSFYRRLADDNVAELAAMIRQAAAEPKSTERELALAVLLKRYSELDALGAVRLAREAGVGGMALSSVYGAWARKAPGQALAALSTVERPEAAATVALALIEALGNDAAAVRRVGSVLAARKEDPIGSPVFGPVSAAGPSALSIVAQRWADLDPRRAYAVARELDDERVRQALESAALRALARTAPAEAFAHFATLGNDARQVAAMSGTLIELARADPERVLAAAADFPPDARRLGVQVAIQQLAERDLLAAVRYVEGMSPSPEREQMLQVVARSYGKRDVAAALAWARAQPQRDNLVAMVIAGVAEQDANRAIDLALELTSPIERDRALQFVAMSAVSRDDATVEALANRLLALEGSQPQSSVGFNIASMWAQRSPDRAMSWLLANGQNASPNIFMQVGQQLAMRDPKNAIAYTTQIPAGARESWARGVGQGYARSDPEGAIDWLVQFRGEDWYARAAVTVAMDVAQMNPAAAARLVDGLDSARGAVETQRLTNVIASSWAGREPAAAAAWALDRPTEQERAMAVQGVINAWSGRDADGARQWTLTLPQGQMRDGALTTLLTASTLRSPAGLDARVLNGFASEAARQQAVMQVVQNLAYADAARARSIADAHLTDAAMRAQVERVLEAARNNPERARLGPAGPTQVLRQ